MPHSVLGTKSLRTLPRLSCVITTMQNVSCYHNTKEVNCSFDRFSFQGMNGRAVATAPWKKFKFFWRISEHLKVGEGPGGSGSSEKHIWKIFYQGDLEIGTPGTPPGSQGTKFFFEKFSLEKLLGYM